MVYASYTNYVGDKGINGYFFLDKEDTDYSQEWQEQSIGSARIIKDSTRINLFMSLMEKVNLKNNLAPSSKVIFIESGYPEKTFAYVASEIIRAGFILLFVFTLLSIKYNK